MMDEKLKFISRYLSGERITDLCLEFGISRKTGYKFLNRYRSEGIEGLLEKSREAKRKPHKVRDQIVTIVLDIKANYPTWGAPKIREIIKRKYPSAKLPAKSTIHSILERHNLVTKKKRRGLKASGTLLKEAVAPNDIWAADFKGQFRLKNNRYCYPLTVTDQHCRYILGCEGFESISEEKCFYAFERIFEEYGLPNTIRTDNGVPFATRSYFGVSALSVWWLRLGINLERIKPGNPQENGRHERMHRTLNASTAKNPGNNFLVQQELFDSFVETFNNERPHEGIGMKVPSDLYKGSSKKFARTLEIFNYRKCDYELKVSKCGSILLPNRKRVFVGTPFRDQFLGVKEIDEGIYELYFLAYKIGFFDDENHKLTPIADAFWEVR